MTAEDDDLEFELVTNAVDSLVTAVGTHGGHLASATVAEGELRFVVEFPTGRDKHQLVDLVEANCDGAVPHAQRTVERDEFDAAAARSVFRSRLTEKQRTALEVAFRAGYFDWPRESTGEEVSDRLGVSPATFTQHLRVAERKFFEAVFGDEREDPRAASSWTPLQSESGDE
jgi:predicted DNA binding protein